MHSSLLASSTLVIWKGIETYGLDARALFERAGLDPASLEDPAARYPYQYVRKLWELAIEETGDPCFVLTAVRQWHPGNYQCPASWPGLSYPSAPLSPGNRRTL